MNRLDMALLRFCTYQHFTYNIRLRKIIAIVEDVLKKESKPVDFDRLKQRFFNECVSEYDAGGGVLLSKIDLSPNNTFRWLKDYLGDSTLPEYDSGFDFFNHNQQVNALHEEINSLDLFEEPNE